jgi:hypothetical protein
MSRPVLRALIAAIAAKGAEFDVRGIEWFCAQVADGQSMKSIGAQFNVSRNFLYSYLNQGGDEYRRLYQKARRMSAEAHAEDALQMVDDADEQSPAGVSKAREQAKIRLWMAERYDREQFGTKVDMNVLQVGELHLDALRKGGGPEHQALSAGDEDIVDAEVIVIEPAMEDLI